jgi:phage gp46-like protein
MLVRIRDTEACGPVPNFLWDTVWINRLDASGGYGDWILAGSDDPPEQRGGLRARMQLMTAILIQVFSDKRLPEGMRNPTNSEDPRGWWGDSIKLDGEPAGETGSLLWTLERERLDDDTALQAQRFIEDALQTLIDQGAVSRFEVACVADRRHGILSISIGAFDRGGKPITNPFVFDVVWRQLRTPAPMTFANVR